MERVFFAYSIMAIALFLRVSHGQAKPVASEMKVIQIALSSSPSQLNPFFSTDANSQNIGRLIHQSLVDLDEQMRIVCRLCVTFSQEVVDKSHRVRFKLKEDARFWDGGQVTAQDVENSVQYFTSEDPRIQSVFRFAFKSIKEVKIHGRFDVEFVFEKFDLENLSNLPLLKIIKIPALDSETSKGSETKDRTIETGDIIGAGEYQLDEVKDYLIKLSPSLKRNLPVLLFKIVKDETTLALKLLNGEVDLSLAELSPRKYFWLIGQKLDIIKIWSTTGTNLNYIGINHKRDVLKDVRVRRALNLLIPRDDILKFKVKGMATAAYSLLSPAFKGSSMASEGEKYSPELARELLDKAGFTLKKGHSGEKGQRMELNWRLSNGRMTVEVAETIASYWEKEGIKINLIPQEWGTFYRGFKNGEYDIVSASWVGIAGPEMLRAVFHSENFAPKGLNRGHYSNAVFDDYIDRATRETREMERNLLYQKAQKAIQDDYPYLYLWHPHIVWIGRSCLRMENPYPNGSFLSLLKLESDCQGKESDETGRSNG